MGNGPKYNPAAPAHGAEIEGSLWKSDSNLSHSLQTVSDEYKGPLKETPIRRETRGLYFITKVVTGPPDMID